MRRAEWALCVLALSGTACGSVPEMRYYTLTASPAGAPAETAAHGLVVGVETFEVDPPYDQGQLVYRPGADASQVGFYEYHRWASSLGRLTAAAVAEGLAGTPGVAASELTSGASRHDLTLTGRVARLEEVDVADGQLVRLELRLRLTSTEEETLWSRTLSSETRIQAADASEIVDRVRADLQGLIAEARDGIGEVLANR